MNYFLMLKVVLPVIKKNKPDICFMKMSETMKNIYIVCQSACPLAHKVVRMLRQAEYSSMHTRLGLH